MPRIPTAFALGALLLGGCTWVQLTDPGEAVRVGTRAQVARCEKLGFTHSKTSASAGIFSRSQEKIDRELEYLARNEAAEMGADTIVPQGPTTAEGRRSFDVYRCAGDY